jgi:hypothetical protein
MNISSRVDTKYFSRSLIADFCASVLNINYREQEVCFVKPEPIGLFLLHILRRYSQDRSTVVQTRSNLRTFMYVTGALFPFNLH